MVDVTGAFGALSHGWIGLAYGGTGQSAVHTGPCFRLPRGGGAGSPIQRIEPGFKELGQKGSQFHSAHGGGPNPP